MFTLDSIPTNIKASLLRSMKTILKSATESGDKTVNPEQLQSYAETIALIENGVTFQIQDGAVDIFRDMIEMCEGLQYAKEFTEWVDLKRTFSVLGN